MQPVSFNFKVNRNHVFFISLFFQIKLLRYRSFLRYYMIIYVQNINTGKRNRDFLTHFLISDVRKKLFVTLILFYVGYFLKQSFKNKIYYYYYF